MRTTTALTIVLLASCLRPASAQTYTIVTSTFSNGGGVQMVGAYTLTHVIGQSMVGTDVIGSNTNGAGFLFQYGGSVGDPQNTGTFAVSVVSDTGEGSLRAALDSANARAGLNIINFNIPGSGVHTITPSSPLPQITDAVIIDGYSQPGASPNTNGPGLGMNAVLLIELNGVNTGSDGCLNIRANGCTVRGLVVNRSPDAGIRLRVGGNHVIEGNFIGTDPSGTIAQGNLYGVAVDYNDNDMIGGTTPASCNLISGNTVCGIGIGVGGLDGGTGHLIQGNLIGTNAAGAAALGNGRGICLAWNTNNVMVGGTTPAARNVISGNTITGVTIGAALGLPDVSNNLVIGNFIGTDVAGTAAVGNAQDGVAVFSLNNAVGGSAQELRNIISGNGRNGVHIFSGDSCVVQGNYIGTDVTGTLPLGNQETGVYLTAHDVAVGGISPGAGNIVAFNGTDPAAHAGVGLVGASTRNAVLGNSIFANVGLGVDLGGPAFLNGVTPNDSCDQDSLIANNYQNYPVLTSAQSGGGSTIIEGMLHSKPNETYRLEFFSNPQPDSTQFGEGEAFLGSADVMTDGSCTANFSVTLPTGVPAGYFVSATATDPMNNTSEFSGAISVGQSSVTVSIPLARGWNVVSNPVLGSADSTLQLFPNSVYPYAFSFTQSGGYEQTYVLPNSLGYWVKFPASEIALISGSPITTDTFYVSRGWNLVGSLSNPVDTASIVSNPPDLRSSLWFGFDGGYVPASEIVPGKGYWVKANSSGTFILTSSSVPRTHPGQHNDDFLSTLTISDGDGCRQELFLWNGPADIIDPGEYEVPPPGPAGVLDARFESGRMLETLGKGGAAEHGIFLGTEAYPLTVHWKLVAGLELAIRDGANGTLLPPKEISGAGSLTIVDPEITRLLFTARPAEAPREFLLGQNYPNPFNPSTTIGYGLPFTVHVELKIYDILGQEVATLVNEIQGPGFKLVEWNASGTASGVYFYRLRAGDFAASRKLLLLK